MDPMKLLLVLVVDLVVLVVILLIGAKQGVC